MFNIVSLIKNELLKNYAGNKNYFFNYTLGVMRDFLVLLGFIFLGGELSGEVLLLDFSINSFLLIRIFSWFVLTGTVGKLISEMENEIQMNYLKNLIHQNVDFNLIVFSRIMAIFIELIMMFVLPTITILFVFQSVENMGSYFSSLILYILIIFVVTTFSCYFFTNLVLKLKRISAVHGIFKNYLLFFSGFVFLDSNYGVDLFYYLNNVLEGRLSFGIFMALLLIVAIFVTSTIVLGKMVENKIRD